MRCPDCNKFVSFDEPQCELQSVDVSGEEVTAQVSIRLNCAECGNTLKDAEVEALATIVHTCEADGKPDEGWKEGDEQFEVENDGEPEGCDRYQDKDRHGKPIKSSRYMKHFYGFTLETGLHCCKCGENFGINLEGEEQAGSFNECC